MPMYLLKVWTGPSYVHEIAAKVKEAGMIVETEGTEHIFVRSEGGDGPGACWNFCVELGNKLKTDFGLRPLVVRQL